METSVEINTMAPTNPVDAQQLSWLCWLMLLTEVRQRGRAWHTSTHHRVDNTGARHDGQLTAGEIAFSN